jgi:hypothetical protein
MVEPECLKSGLESVEQVKSEKKETGDVENIHPAYLELLEDHGTQVMIMLSVINHFFHMSVTELGLDVKVEEVDHQEDQDDQGRMDHELGKERGLGIIIYLIPLAPGHPVDDLYDQSINDVKEDTSEEDNLEDLDDDVGGHEVGRNVEDPRIIEQDQGDVNTQVYQ